jgi:hypothetical protein
MKEIINIGNVPLVNNLFKTKKEALNCEKFELKIVEKKDLKMQLDLEINPDKLFSNYLYRSSINIPYIKHCEKMWDVLKKYNPKTIVDIGGNDGALLKAFKAKSKKPLNLINFDASTSFKTENEKLGIKYINAYWGSIKLEEKADIIVSTNVFQHNTNYIKFIKGIKKNLNGHWVLEFPYFLTTVKTNQFDQIYHEHIYYWLVTPLINVFRKYGLKIQSITEHNMHGGSLRIISSNLENDNENTKIINKYLKKEQEFSFKKWGEQIKLKIAEDSKYIASLKGTVAVFGAAAKGCVYLNCLNQKNKISYIVDDTKEKQNNFSPGTGLKIVNREFLYKDNPDNLIILAHNFKEYIIKSLRDDGFKNKIIVMIPDITVY